MIDYDFDNLHLKNDEVYKLNESKRIERLNDLIKESYLILDLAKEEYLIKENREMSCTTLLFSGGNDSTALLYLFKDKIDYVIHLNTGIGIEQTREFVRDVCKQFNLVLKEYTTDEENSYENLIYQRGFPGPGQHFLMYQRLKERGLRKARKELNPRYRKTRIVHIAGRRRDESVQRMNIPYFSREKAAIWVSPLYNWTKTDIETYRKLNPDMPRNEVSDLIHMSGECLCGAFARRGEKEELRLFFPEVVEHIERLEKRVKDLNMFPEHRTNWGWGNNLPKKENKKVGLLCSSCESDAITICDDGEKK